MQDTTGQNITREDNRTLDKTCVGKEWTTYPKKEWSTFRPPHSVSLTFFFSSRHNSIFFVSSTNYFYAWLIGCFFLPFFIYTNGWIFSGFFPGSHILLFCFCFGQALEESNDHKTLLMEEMTLRTEEAEKNWKDLITTIRTSQTIQSGKNFILGQH